MQLYVVEVTVLITDVVSCNCGIQCFMTGWCLNCFTCKMGH